MNCQIRDEIVIDVDTVDNSTNNARSTDYLNEERRLATSWERYDNFTSASLVNNINSSANSGWGANSLSNEGNAGGTSSTYRLPALDVDTSKISGPLAKN